MSDDNSIPSTASTPSKEQRYQTALEVLAELEQSSVPLIITEDEKAAIAIVRDALKGVAAGEVLEPWVEGMPFKMRQVRKIDVRFFHPNVLSKPKPTTPQ